MPVDFSDKNSKSAKSTAGQGFGTSTKTQPNTAPDDIDNGGAATAAGLSNVLVHQGSEFGLVAQGLEEQMDKLAEPIADYFADVVSGKALVSKVLEKMGEKASSKGLSMSIGDIEPPKLPKVASTKAADFFTKPKPIALPGA